MLQSRAIGTECAPDAATSLERAARAERMRRVRDAAVLGASLPRDSLKICGKVSAKRLIIWSGAR